MEDNATNLILNDAAYVWKYIKTGNLTGIDEISSEMTKSVGNAGEECVYTGFFTRSGKKIRYQQTGKSVVIPIVKI